MRLSTKQIEEHAVSAVKERINLSPYLEAYINENDKGPLWDGYICVYKNTERANANIDGRFPVQIKGKEAPDQSRNEITYQFNCDNLRHYLRDGGAMLFVVYLSVVLDADGCDDIKKTIYYNTLTPVKLMQILQGIKRADQETIAVRLTRLPRASQDLSNICLNFLIDCHKQSSFACTSLPTIEQLLEKGAFDGIVTSVSSYGEMPDPIGSFLQSETYVYAKIKGTDVLMPLNIFPEAKTISETIHANISVNNKLYYSSYCLIRSATTSTARIGDCLSITMFRVQKNCKVSFELPDGLRERYKAASFLQVFLQNEGFEINGKFQGISLNDKDKAAKDSEILERIAMSCRRVVDMLDKLNCSDDIFISQMKPVDWRNLDSLVKAILDNVPIKNLPSNCAYVGKYDVGKLHFAVCAEQDKADKSAYYISDFFSSDVRLVASFKNPELDGVEVPKYFILHKDELLNISNICFDRLLSAYQQFEMTPFLADCANTMLLDLISAYDEATGKRQQALYNTAIAFAEWLLDTSDDMLGHNVKLLNKLQLIKRKCVFTYEERQLLLNMEENSPESDDIRVGIYLLLDDHERAERYYQKLDEKTKTAFMQYPIYKFWKHSET